MLFLLVLKRNKNRLKFCRKTCWKEQPFIFTFYLMNHFFLILNWAKHGFSWVSLNQLSQKLSSAVILLVSETSLFSRVNCVKLSILTLSSDLLNIQDWIYQYKMSLIPYRTNIDIHIYRRLLSLQEKQGHIST